MVCLVDLINLDMVYNLSITSVSLALNFFVISAGIKLPDALAFILVMNMWTFMFAFMTYLTLGAIIQYAYIRLRSTSPYEYVSDEVARTVIRIFVGSLCATLGVWGSFYSKNSQMLSNLTKGASATSEGGSISIYLWTAGALLLICVITNLILRPLILYSKKAASVALANHVHATTSSSVSKVGKKSVQIPVAFYVAGPFVAFCCFASAAATMHMGGNSYRLRMGVTVPLFCVIMPLIYLCHNKKLREHSKKELGKGMEDVMLIIRPKRNKISVIEVC